MKQRDSFHPNIGGSSILMIFLVLCLTAFAVLSLVTAAADKKLSTKNAETVKNYYDASARVQAALQQADGGLLTARADAQKAVQNPLFLACMSDSVYTGDTQACKEIEALLKSSAPAEEKLAQTYRYFARRRIAQNRNLTASEENGALTVSFTEKADSARLISVKFLVLPYGETPRYRLLEEKTVAAQEQTEDSETLQLWTGESAAAG